jgi:hypothetical protein
MTEPTSDPTGGSPAPAAPAAAPTAAQAAANALTLAMGGAALILVVYVVFDVLLEQYFLQTFSWLLAVAIVVAGYIKTRGGDVPLGAVTVIKVAGLAIGLIALTDLISELRNGVFDDVVDIVAGLGYYIGAAAAAAGAWTLKR